MTTPDPALFAAYTAGVARARRSYRAAPSLFADIVATACNPCRFSHHKACRDRSHVKPRTPCGCRELRHLAARDRTPIGDLTPSVTRPDRRTRRRPA